MATKYPQQMQPINVHNHAPNEPEIDTSIFKCACVHAYMRVRTCARVYVSTKRPYYFLRNYLII